MNTENTRKEELEKAKAAAYAEMKPIIGRIAERGVEILEGASCIAGGAWRIEG